jgi:hypothetical protein
MIMVFGKKKAQPPQQGAQQPPPKKRYFAVKAESILKNEISIDQLAEPYALISSRRDKVGNIMYVVNLLARRRGYKINSFAVSRFFAYVIVEKTMTATTGGSSTTAATAIPPPPTEEELTAIDEVGGEESLTEEEEE